MTATVIPWVGVLLQPEDAALLVVAARAVRTEHARIARMSGSPMPVGLEGLLAAVRECARGADLGPGRSDVVPCAGDPGAPFDADLATVGEVAELMRVTERAVVRALGDGRITGYQRSPGCPWQVDRASLQDWTPRRRRADSEMKVSA